MEARASQLMVRATLPAPGTEHHCYYYNCYNNTCAYDYCYFRGYYCFTIEATNYYCYYCYYAEASESVLR